MDRHAENALALADYLSKHPKVAKVMYPFHESHPQVHIAKRQMRSGSGMISMIMKDGGEAAIRFAEATKIFTLAESLGGVESLIEVPAAMTHLSTAGSQIAVDPGLVRLSVGIEHKDDLLEDIEEALKKA
jgi:cystathionine beta-lyase/cystathionine gamma-synthase